jgi:hypothetical protein
MSIYDTTAPASGGKYLKFSDGDKHQVRLFGEAISYEAEFDDEENPGKKKIVTQFASLCLYRNKPEKKSEVKVLQFGWTVLKALKAFREDADWGDPTQFDIEISATGERLTRKYAIIPKPKTPLSADDQALVDGCDWTLRSMVGPKDSHPPASTVTEGAPYDPFAEE